jgi:hypothetical protein
MTRPRVGSAAWWTISTGEIAGERAGENVRAQKSAP